MKIRSSIVLVSVALLSILAVGCKKADDDTTTSGDGTTLATTELQLVEDDSEAADTDDDLESGLDEPLSGAADTDPGTPADGATDDEVLEKVRSNPGLFFRPAGCIVSTRAANVITHVFTNCRGPWGTAEFNGTVTSTWVREAGKITVTHQVDGFKANGATITGSRVVVYTREGTVVTKSRTGQWSGTTAKGRSISHQASFMTTYDASTKCLTRDGAAQTTIDSRSYERTIDGYKRCGIGRLGCPESGKLTLSRTNSTESLSLTIEFLGGTKYQVTRPSGRVVQRTLICNPNAS